jgi:hypothetical protein
MKAFALTQDGRGLDPSECCSVAVVYEDTEQREPALRLKNLLGRQFGEDMEFQFTWWGFKYLADPQVARLATEDVLEADIIIFSMHAAGKIPFEVWRWIETWCVKRQENEGALGVLLAPERHAHKNPNIAYLQNVARQAGLDFLILESEDSQISNPVNPAMIVPARTYPITHWGINE